MSRKEELMTELFEIAQEEEERTGEDLINMHLIDKPVHPGHLHDLITFFCWLDEEHQSRATSALNSILQDQIAETKAEAKAI